MSQLFENIYIVDTFDLETVSDRVIIKTESSKRCYLCLQDQYLEDRVTEREELTSEETHEDS